MFHPICASTWHTKSRPTHTTGLREETKQIIVRRITTRHGTKVQLSICVLVHQVKIGEVISQPTQMFMGIRLEEYTDDCYEEGMTQLIKKLDEYVKNGCGWIVYRIEKVGLVITSHRHLNPHKRHADVVLPKALKGKHAVIDLEGIQERECFKLSILCAQFREQILQQRQALANKYNRFLDKLNFEQKMEATTNLLI